MLFLPTTLLGGEPFPIYITGDRTGTIALTFSPNILYDGGTYPGSNLIDGSFVQNASGSTVWNNVSIAGEYVQFDFGSGVSMLVTEATYYQSDTSNQGTWKWQGSELAISWTDIGSSFTLGGATSQTHTQLNGNTTGYRYYRMLGVSGSTTFNPWVEEIEFKQDPF